MSLIDLSHTIIHGQVTYKGLPAPVICDYLSRVDSRSHYIDGTEFHIGKIEMVANTGTYIDSPFHRYADGLDVSQLKLESIANLDALTVSVPAGVKAVTAHHLEGLEIRHRAVLFHTGWARHWGSESYSSGHVHLTESAAKTLVRGGAQLVGIDSYNIDDTSDLRRPVHSLLLGAGIPIVEHMRGLELLPANGFKFFAVPAKVSGMGTFPVRAFALIT